MSGGRQISGNLENQLSAFIDGAEVAFDEAIQRCADLLVARSQPVFAHLGVDIAGAREAIRLAELTGGVLDHASSEALFRDLDPLRETGGLTTTPLEADVRTDVVLLIGAVRDDPNLAWLTRPARPSGEFVERRLVALPGGEEALRALAKLRYEVKRPVASGDKIAAGAETVRSARFGVAIWRAEDLSLLAVEAIHGLVRDLNETTRFSTLALAAPDNALGVQAACGWMTGFPLRTGFGRGYPEHDPWRFDARRLIAAGETDCVVWISSLPDAKPPMGRVDILLDDGRAALAAPPRVRIVVSSSNVGVVFDPRVGTLVASGMPSSAAAALAAIRERVEASC